MNRTPSATTTYHATFELDQSGEWLAQIDEIPEVHTFGRTLGKAQEYVIDALALWLNVPVAHVNGSVEFHEAVLPSEIKQTIDAAVATRELAVAATNNANEFLANAAVALVDDARLSMRDAARILGVSHQRVQQLVARRRDNLTPKVLSSSEAARSIARTLKEFLPGGSKDDLGAALGVVGLAVAIAWFGEHN